jgi:hypothetical protein
MENDGMISRAAAIDALTDTNIKRNVDSLCDGDMNRTRRAAQRIIAQLPVVDAAPVVHAKAIAQSIFDKKAKGCIYTAQWICSNCADYIAHSWNYCPECGAKLDAEAPTCGPDYCEIGGGDDAR